MTHRACDCDDADIDVSYRMCCISVNISPPFKASTLFDAGAHASLLNRKVAAWIGQRAGRATRLGARKRGREGDSNTSVSLAGTSLSSPVLEVIDSCIAVIIGRPIIRGNHLVRKIPLYFDEIPSSKPYLSQPVVPVTTPVTSRARCRGTESCDTLCSLSVLRTDHPHVPTKTTTAPCRSVSHSEERTSGRYGRR